LLIDLDTQPSLSSFYRIEHEAVGGTYQLIAQNDTRALSHNVTILRGVGRTAALTH